MTLQPFEEIVADHGPTVLRVCRAVLGPDDAQDAWSETFLSALRAYPDLRDDTDMRRWLVTVAHHRSVDQIRRRERTARPSGDLPEPASVDPAPTGEHGDLLVALDALPFKQRGAVAYRYLADLSYADIAELLDCSEAAARKNASDGIARLRTLYPQGAPR